MSHYIELTLIQQAEISSPIMMSALFSKLHLVLVELPDNIGLSFPDFFEELTDEPGKSRLGERLRLHGDKAALSQVLNHRKIMELSDYAVFSNIQKVPDKISHYAYFVRKHIKGKRDLLRKQKFLQEKSGGEWNESAKESMQRFFEKQKCRLPFVYIISYSSKAVMENSHNHFRLFIEKREGEKRQGCFNKYGLSEARDYASVPIFK